MPVFPNSWWRGRNVLVAALVASGSAKSPVFQVRYSVFPAARTAGAQPIGNPRVTLNVHDSTVSYIVRALVRQAHLRFAYDVDDKQFSRRVTVHVDHMKLMDALAVALKGTGLAARFASDGETVLVQSRSASGDKVQIIGGTIAGRVTDSASHAGLSGATVRVAGLKISTVTADSGGFTLRDVPPGEQVLSIKLFGYKPVQRQVTVVDSQQTIVHVTMVSIPTVLSGVVTTATGLQRKVEVGNDITSLNVDSIMRVAPVTSVTDLLETRVPGLTVLHSSGVPGDPSRIRLRGASSITGNNDPIIVVDGARVYASQSDPRNNNLAPVKNGGISVTSQKGGLYAAPSPLDQIDPNSIETIEVFKGPSASAMYGSDAANGVIVITTKHGRAGPTHWNLELGQGVNWLPGSWPVNYYRFGSDGTGLSDNLGGMCVWYDPNCARDSLVPFQALNDPRYTVFSHGGDQIATLTVSGGTPTLQYSLSGSGTTDIGNLKLPAIEQRRYEQFYGPVPSWMIRPDNYKTWGMNGQLTAHPSPVMHVTLTSILQNGIQQRSSLEQAIPQLEGEYINNGNIFVNGGQGVTSQSGLTNTPLIQNEVERATDNQLTSTYALTLGWQPLRWLPLDATGGLNIIQRNDQTYIPYGVSTSGPGTAIVQGGVCSGQCDTTGSFGLGRGTSQDKTLAIGTAIPTLFNRVTVALGGNWYNGSTADVNAYTNQLSPGVSEPTTFPTIGCEGGVGGCSFFDQSASSSSTYGWYVEPRLNISSRFFAAPGFRLDGGSASGARGGFAGSGLTGFPKIDFSYIAIDQSHPRGILTMLRPRLAFGYAGTQPAPAEKLRLLNSGGGQVVGLNDSTTVPSVNISTLGNTQLRPETSSELEGGLDAELWHGRFSFTYTQYNKTRHNAIIPITVAPSVLGVQVIEENIGVVRNTGTEVTVNAQLLQSRMVSWTVGMNLSNDKNLVVRLNPGFAPNKQLGIVAGFPLFSDWAKPIVTFADANQDGIIERNEIVLGDSSLYVGQVAPKYQANFNTSVTLLNGRLGISATFAYQNGMTQNNAVAISSGAADFLANAPGASLATQAAIVAADQGDLYGQTSDVGFLQTVNTFRFNALSINYTLPRSVSTWFHVPSASVALQGSNLALHTNYRGKDPGVNAFSTVSAGDETEDLGQIPEPRTWWLKLSLGN